MPKFPRRSHTGRDRAAVVGATAYFIVVTAAVVGVIGHALQEMAVSGNELDDHRAIRAANAAVASITGKLSGTAVDNAVWDDAFKAVTSDNARDWTYENWGKVSEDYEFYDAAIVTGPDGSVLSAHLKGQPFDPYSFIGRAALERHLSDTPATEPAVGFTMSANGPAVIASAAIRPYDDGHRGNGTKVSFLLFLDDQLVSDTAATFGLEGLSFAKTRADDELSIPLTDTSGNEIGALNWPGRHPGTTTLAGVKHHLAQAAAMTGLLLLSLAYAGHRVYRRLRLAADRAIRDAAHDPLTGLFNRKGIMSALDEAEAGHLHIVDLQQLHLVNDTWGHEVGDLLLQQAGERLKACHGAIRHASRLDGDSFALVSGPSNSGMEVALAVLSCLDRPFIIGGRTIQVQGCAGTAELDAALAPMEALRRADVALHRAKEAGHGTVVAFDSALDNDRLASAELVERLRNGLLLGEVKPYFQPIVDGDTGRTVAVEALARWTAPEGPVSPAVFIPLAERAGLIDALGTEILRRALLSAANWDGITLSVNVSPIQLCNPEFARNTMRLIQSSGFDPRRLILEITEGVLMANPEQATKAISALKQQGVRFALDDFGCGFASIGTLRSFGFDRMKIDKSLIDDVDTSDEARRVLEATLSLARALSIPVTAEGIERPSQAEVLRAAGCDMMQGYLFGRPVTAADIEYSTARPMLAAI